MPWLPRPAGSGHDQPPVAGGHAGAETPAPRLGARVVRDPLSIGLFATTVVIAAFFLAHPVGADTGVIVFWAVQPLLDLLLFALARRIARSAWLAERTRRFWRALSLGGLLFAVGDASQAVVAVRQPGPQAAVAGGVQTACFLVATAWIFYVLLSYPVHTHAGRERLRFWLDAGTALVAAAVFAWMVTVVPDTVDGGVGQLLGVLPATALLIAAAFAAAKLVLAGDAPMTMAAATPAVVGIVVQAACTALTPANLHGDRLHLLLAVRLLPSVLIVLAVRLQQLQLRGPVRPVRQRPGRRFSLLPYVMIVSTYLMLLVVVYPDLDLRLTGVLVGMILTCALVVARQVVALSDNSVLLEQLDASMRELARREQRFRTLVQYSSDITTMLAPDGTLTYVSPSVERVLGHAQSDVLGRGLPELLHPQDLRELWGVWQHLLRSQNVTVTHQARYRHADGSWRWLEVISRNLTHDPDVGGIVCNAREVTETRELHDRLRQQAFHDGLTGLANRALFQQRLAAATGDTRTVAVIMIDLDGFKVINDTLGHHVGDCVLVAVAHRLRTCIRAGDTAARLGGDELAVLLPGADADTAADIAGRFLDALTDPVQVEGELLTVRASIGIAADTSGDPQQLLRQADAAMYTAKRQGKGRCVRAVPHGP